MPQPTPPAEQALRQLADAVDELEPRTAHDLSDPDIPVAATVVLLRDGAGGLEVLMIERPDRGSFAGAWVFPGGKLEDAMKESIEELDGVFTYVVATADSLGMAKDTMAAKPMVLYESKDFIALASEEVAIRSIFPHEIDTFDPYEGEVRVWKA